LLSPTRVLVRIFLPIASFLLFGCGSDQPAAVAPSRSLRPPVFDAAFRQVWDDGLSEVSSYETVRLRAGALRKGVATSVVRRTRYSEDERVPIESAKPAQTDLFPVIQLNWIERYPEGAEFCEEMTTSAVELASVDGRPTGSENKTDFSLQSWDGQLFHQLLFDATGVRSHQYSFFETEGDEQITLPYPADGVSGDALWLWARHMAAPLLAPGEQRTVQVLPSLRDARSQHRALAWKKAAVIHSREPKIFAGRPAEVFSLHSDDGVSETFLVESALPFRVMHWENSSGERADFINGARMKTGIPPVSAATPK
jgi:hypothetical protein